MVTGSAGTTRGKKVLIIEDEPSLAKAMSFKLTREGIDVKAVLRGDEGLNELTINHYDLVLLDIMMPGTDGWQILEAIKQKGLNVKVLIASNLSQDEDVQRAQTLGATDFLIKSDCTLTSIVDKVKSLLQ